jgi:hypothetical protein
LEAVSLRAEPEAAQPSESSLLNLTGVPEATFQAASPRAVEKPPLSIKLPGLGLRHTQVCVAVSQLGVLPLQCASALHCTQAPATHLDLLPLQTLQLAPQ